MATPDNTGLSRVTLVAPRTRVDLALPSDVPLADLLPTLLRYAGDDLADDTGAQQGWALSRLGGLTLDNSRTPSQLDVRDGELLYLRPRDGDAPDLVFDDVVDAVATATQQRPGRWTPAATRAFGVALGLLALLGGAMVILLAGPPQLLNGLVGLGMTVAMLVTSVVLARALGDSRTGFLFALIACVYAAAGGLLVFGGDRSLSQLSAPHALIGAIAVLVTTAVAAVGVADATAVFLGAGICATALVIGAAISMLTGAGPVGAAAVVVSAAFATVPALPLLAYRLARLPIPSVPSGPEDLKRDTESVEGGRILALSDRADAFLSGLLGALAVLGAGTAALVSTAGYPGLALAVVLGLLLMARARWFINRMQRLPLLISGATAVGAAAAATFRTVGHELRLTVVFGALLVLAVISVSYGLAGAGRRPAPLWGRLLDLFEALLILALVPLAFWVSGLYDWIRAIRG